MPTWAAVLLPIVTGLIGVLGALGGTWFGVAQAREQERRRILGDAAARFAEKAGGAANAVGRAVERKAPSTKLIEDADYLVGEAEGLVAPVELHFDEETGRVAREIGRQLRAAMATLKESDAAAARATYDRAEDCRRLFHKRARDAIWKGKNQGELRIRPGE